MDYFDSEQRFIPAHGLPGLMIDMAVGRGVNAHALLRGSGIFVEDIPRGRSCLSAAQLLRIISNLRQALPTADLPFAMASSVLPGFREHLTTAFTTAAHLFDALQLLLRYPLTSFPLLKARWIEDGDECGIEWQDVFNVGCHRIWLVELASAALVSFANWQQTRPLPWRFEFDYPRPQRLDHYEVNFAKAERLRFNAAACRVWIGKQALYEAWPRASTTAFHFAVNRLQEDASLSTQEGFCGRVTQMMESRLQEGVQLGDIADALSISPATLKRKLKVEGSSFQRLLDAARRRCSVDCLLRLGMSQEEIAEKIGIRDPANFRRAFKRWTGFSPSGFSRLQYL